MKIPAMICFRQWLRPFVSHSPLTNLIFLTVWILTTNLTIAAESPMRAVKAPGSGQIEVSEGDAPVLRYNYQTVEPPAGYLEDIHANNRKYAVPRSNYIHPLYGPDGEELTLDWSRDHPHHRGIYWAWPEVDFGHQRGDLHALQHVFARPTGNIQLTSDKDVAQIKAENEWKWEDTTPIVREVATIVAHRAGEHGRFVDLKFAFTALVDEVAIARRNTTSYGGLNIRLSAVQNLKLLHHADSPTINPLRSWSDSIGIRAGGSRPVGVALFEKTTNPQYPGDYVEYPELPWFQTTFPLSGERFELKRGKPLVLQYRLWIRRDGSTDEQAYDQHWREWNLSTGPN
ncbi:hypothetical protein CA13_25000 [Planctomycetes bacterium CA13]|uniref:Methane oxygenase PmoA n=1 Tax=Novipirellula herctigrandis TaxID=2527986 RepID=A0A5C5Z368_9BACT|nr:hypothetical protein CA13_25000 [Planctomycetes bacterium CA13]